MFDLLLFLFMFIAMLFMAGAVGVYFAKFCIWIGR